MNTHRFSDIIGSLAVVPSRRDVLHGLAAAGLGLAAHATWPLGESAVAAKKKPKKKKKKNSQPQPQPQAEPQPQAPPPPPFNAFGCLDVGQPCQGDSSLCCSGICDGVCVAHNAGTCFPDTDSCTLNANIHCHPSKSLCLCSRTTGNAAFCGDFTTLGTTVVCRNCSKDTECQEELGPGAACVVLKGVCSAACADTGRTACMVPCV